MGHGRSYVFFDTLVKFLKHKKINVNYIQNITDIGKNVKKKAEEIKLSQKEVVDLFEKEYFEIMDLLNVNSVDVYERSSLNIDLAINQINRILKNGHAYRNKNGIFLDSKKLDLGTLSKSVLFEQNNDKQNPIDFALWNDDPSWGVKFHSPFGPGKPHWHIQDTAIAEKHFGSLTYNIHGAGKDCIYPHHESIRLILKSLSGKEEPVDIWMHNELVNINGEKMSKSSNNSIELKPLIEKYSPSVIRIALLSINYQSPIDYSQILFSELEQKTHKLSRIAKKISNKEQPVNNDFMFNHYYEKFYKSLENNLDTKSAIDVFVSFADDLEKKIIDKTLTEQSSKKAYYLFKQFDYILGLGIIERGSKNG